MKNVLIVINKSAASSEALELLAHNLMRHGFSAVIFRMHNPDKPFLIYNLDSLTEIDIAEVRKLAEGVEWIG